MGSTAEFRRDFVSRLKLACDESADIPPPHKGRQKYISEALGVAPEAASKWFKGTALPRPDKIKELAELLKVDQSWLTFGISPEMDRAERKAHSFEVHGAVHLVMGMVMLAGGHCGVPAPNDPRAAYVDFYATVRGSVYPIHISLARAVGADGYELMVPREYKEVRNIGVIPTQSGSFQYLALPTSLIDAHKVLKAGQYALALERGEGRRFQSGDDVWPSMKAFNDFSF